MYIYIYIYLLFVIYYTTYTRIYVHTKTLRVSFIVFQYLVTITFSRTHTKFLLHENFRIKHVYLLPGPPPNRSNENSLHCGDNNFQLMHYILVKLFVSKYVHTNSV